LARAGFEALRIDWAGVGESTGSPPQARLDENLILPLVADVEAVSAWLRGRGCRRVLLMGSCLGSRVALTCVGRVPDLAGLILVTAPVYDYDAARMPAVGGPPGRFADLLGRAVDASLPVLMVYGRADRFATDLELARRGELGALLRRAGDLVTVTLVEHDVYDFPSVAGQDETIEAVAAWATRRSCRGRTGR